MVRSSRLPLALLALAGCHGSGGGDGTPTDGGSSQDASTHDASTSDGAMPDGSTNSGGSGPYFPAGSVYYLDVRALAPVANSSAITAHMEATIAPNGWGGFGDTRGTMRIDFSIAVIEAPAGTTKYTHVAVPGYTYPGECDGAPVPLPPGGFAEENWQTPPDLSGPLTGYDCVDFDGGADCHILIHAPDEHRLYEVYHGTRRANGTFEVGCLAVWDTSTVVGPSGRGVQCTSADAAGYAIAPLLVTPEEVASGTIDHAIRLILPNELIRGGSFHPPATHGTNSTGGANTMPYGARMRLRADYPVDSLAPAARVVARAMQTYGLMLADGGQIALTFASDRGRATTWADVGLEADSLAALRASDFDVLVEGTAITTGATDCMRTLIDE